jgi:hypothetical protein
LAASLIAALAEGGDARITLDPASGLNKYLSGPYPRDVLAYSSSTVSDISAGAFAHLLECEQARAASGKAVDYADTLADLRRRIRTAFDLDESADIVFAPSGTDLEYVALAAVQGRGAGGVHNILLGADEIGSGCVHSAYGRYFAQETALDIAVEPGADIAGCGPISMVDIPVRCGQGQARSSGEISADMAREIAAAKHGGQHGSQHGGKHSLVHCVHGSKTGLVLPNLGDIDALLSDHADAMTVVVDACQARITSEAIAAYLARGAIVLMTGSKFIGAPPFNGWALVPRTMVASAHDLPSGFATVFRRAEFPEHWEGAGALADSANPSLALRLEAAMFELERFQRIPMDRIAAIVAAFEAALDAHLVGPLGARRVLSGAAPGEGGQPGDLPIEMRTLATLDVSGLRGLETFDAAQAVHRTLALEGVRLGQPVKCVALKNGGQNGGQSGGQNGAQNAGPNQGGEWGGTLRVGLSMPQINRWADLPMGEIEQELRRDMGRICQAIRTAIA